MGTAECNLVADIVDIGAADTVVVVGNFAEVADIAAFADIEAAVRCSPAAIADTVVVVAALPAADIAFAAHIAV